MQKRGHCNNMGKVKSSITLMRLPSPGQSEYFHFILSSKFPEEKGIFFSLPFSKIEQNWVEI